MCRLKIVTMVMLITLLKVNIGFCQGFDLIAPSPLGVSEDKTTNLIFEYPVKSVDHGHKNILVQKAINAENVLQLKAAVKGIKETNLTVITADGAFYSFMLYYTPNPTELNVNLKKGRAPATNSTVAFSDGTVNEGKLALLTRRISVSKPTIQGVKDRSAQMSISLDGLYINQDQIFLQLRVVNDSHLVFPVDQLRAFIADKKQSKRTASQEIELEPVFVNGSLTEFPAKSEQTIVLVYPLTTIPDKKVMHLQLFEKQGGRKYSIKIKNEMIVKALPIR